MYFVHVYIHIFLKKNSKKFKISKSFPKKKKNFQKKKKGLWTRGIEPLSHLKKKKKNLWTRGIGLPNDFFKKGLFFSYKDFKILKSLLFKMVHEDPSDKTFSKSWCLKAWTINLYQGMINFI